MDLHPQGSGKPERSRRSVECFVSPGARSVFGLHYAFSRAVVWRWRRSRIARSLVSGGAGEERRVDVDPAPNGWAYIHHRLQAIIGYKLWAMVFHIQNAGQPQRSPCSVECLAGRGARYYLALAAHLRDLWLGVERERMWIDMPVASHKTGVTQNRTFAIPLRKAGLPV